MGAIRSSLLGVGTLTFILWGLVTNPVSASSSPAPQPQAARPSQAELSVSKGLFDESCSRCHGQDATGGVAPNIQRAPAMLGDDAVAKIIRTGIPGTGMPAFTELNETQATQIVAYIRTLARATLAGSGKVNQVVPGDPEQGKAVYNANGCASCHTVRSEGGDLGPDLTEVGSVRPADYLHAVLRDPGANLPKSPSTGISTGKWNQYLMFRAVTKDGHATEGMRINEDSFNIVLQDSKGDFHSFHKPSLQALEKESGKSFMPSFQKLSATDLDNLVAYLASLKGAQ